MTIVQRLNYLWLAVIAAILVGGNVAAGADDRGLWHTWRGPAMVALSLTFLGWFLIMAARRRRPRYGWPPPRRVAYLWVGSGLAIAASLLAIDRNFIGLTYALMGAGLVLPAWEALLPMGVAIALCAWARGILPVESMAQTAGGLFDIGLSVGITFAITALIRERFEREHLFQKLSEAHRQLRTAAARDVEMAALRERNRLAREMHDGLGHALVVIAMKIEAGQRLQAVDPARAAAELEDTKALVRLTMSDLRSSLAGLRLPVLDERPFGEALRELAAELGRRSGVELAVDIAAEADLLDRAAQEALYRVAQEALTNVAKHAHALRAALTLAVNAGSALLQVCDDGVGLGAERRMGRGHFGIVGMRERVEALGGEITLGPGPEGGTVLRARIPLKEEALAGDPYPIG